jgi:hypothetical protein
VPPESNLAAVVNESKQNGGRSYDIEELNKKIVEQQNKVISGWICGMYVLFAGSATSR